MTEQDTSKSNDRLPLRENLVKTAVQFLQNPKVSTSPLGRKEEFLRRKGLTEEEITTAFKLASVDIRLDRNVSNDPKDYTIFVPPQQAQIPYYPYLQENPYRITLFYRIKEFFNAAAFVGATLYCVHWFYKKFIEPFLFGRKKRESVQDTVSQLDKTLQNSMREVKDSISKVEGDVQKLSRNQIGDPAIPQLVQELKQDLSSLKSLLLSRKQFPSAPASIPSWQLDAAVNTSHHDKPNEREDDAGSGSSTNNSDSSLEMIREDPPKE